MRQFKHMHSERGATLILVLFILLILTLVAGYSVRQSTSDISLTTSSQIRELLFQSSELGFAKVEQDARANTRLNNSNLRGYMFLSDRSDKEIVFCLRPQQATLFSVANITERLIDASPTPSIVDGRNNGYCDLNDDESFLSQRQATITQVTAKNREPPEGTEAYVQEVGADIDLRIARPQFMDVYAVSVLPAFSDQLGNLGDTTAATVSGCMTQLVTAIGDCLNNLNIPYDIHFQAYRSYSPDFERDN